MGQYYYPLAIEKRNPNSNILGWVNPRNVKSFYLNDRKERCDYLQGLKLMEHSYINNKLMRIIEGLLVAGGAWYKKRIVWAGDYADKEKNTNVNLHTLCDRLASITPKPLSLKLSKQHRYIVNHSKKIFVDKDSLLSYIHPLSILTCEGNGRGGGDYRYDNNLIGTWARDSISMETELPIGYKQLDISLSE